ncbi:magnesium/cobalt transporter CorA [Planctomyces sp. SH-PL62]|uniref:magnesium/cobalt transporter CorA n=1 Tax=Planctomyces sp. SH-PL62 TaxID=1636152 RepID=UPI00078D5F7B|nr:magnesium/cobalt transporter CorA [Planctomyces sp. SH-PL62]AMV39397.1 Magnesium transport protein CorA [Planctomyces sp. SH-PL62]
MKTLPEASPKDCESGENPGVRLRALYRDGHGEMHLNWPIERLDEAIRDELGTLWLDIDDAPGQPSAVAEHLLRDVFRFHPLAIEDALRETHVSKIDDWDDYLYLVFHSTSIDPEADDLRLEELDVFLGPNYLVTYHERTLAFLSESREAIEHDPRDRMKHGADHLLFRFLDRSVDQSLAAIEQLDERIDRVQDEVMERMDPRNLQKIFRIKRSAIQLQRTFSPQRDVLNRLARDPYRVVKEEHRIYFRDVYDHVVRIHDISESLRDLIAGTLDTYLSVMSNRSNDIMKTLTMVTVMFMPMSFIVGFFGMNFFGATLALETWLPKWALFLGSIAIMSLSPVGMLAFARRRRWL